MAAKTEVKAQPSVQWVKAQRSDGKEAHNLETTTDGRYLYLRIDLQAPPILSSNQKPMVCCSYGFIGLMDNTITLSLNAMDKRKRA